VGKACPNPARQERRLAIPRRDLIVVRVVVGSGSVMSAGAMGRRTKTRLCAGLLLVALAAGSFHLYSTRFRRIELPFAPGEKLVYELRWGVVTAGTATLVVLPPEEIDGVEAQHFALSVETVGLVDAIYPVRNRVDSFMTPDLRRSLRYLKRQREGRHKKRDVTVRFDWDRQVAQYTNLDHTRPEVELAPETVDPLGAFYRFRSLPLEVGGTHRMAVTDGKRVGAGSARVIREETIETAAGTFDTYLVEPDMGQVHGVFRKTSDAKVQVWITRDPSHIPVRVASKVVIGSFVGELVGGEGIPGRATADAQREPKRPAAAESAAPRGAQIKR